MKSRGTPASELRERFAQEYVLDLNATKAAQRVGIAPGNSKQSGSRLLKHPEVAARVKELLQARAQRVEIKADTVLREIARLAFSDVRQIFDEQGRVRPVKDWPEDLAPAIASFEVVKRNLAAGDDKSDEVLKVRVWDKPKALEMLSKHLGLLTEHIEHQGEITFRWVK